MKIRIPPDRKLFGANMVPTPANVAVESGLRAWSQMILNWNWEGWVKPQIDYLVGNNVGCNVIRLIGGAWGVRNGQYSQTFYDDKILQVANYLNSIGAYFYAGCGDISNDTVYDFSEAGLQATAVVFASTLIKLQALPNVIGVDVIQEPDNSGFLIPQLVSIVQRLKALGVTLPLTCSTAEAITTSGGPWINVAAPSFDFIDIHMYKSIPFNRSQFDYFLQAFPGKDILIGEYGLGQDFSVDQQNFLLDTLLDLGSSGHPNIRGALMWACTDQNTVAGQRFGMYSDAFAIRQNKVNILRRYTRGSLAKANTI